MPKKIRVPKSRALTSLWNSEKSIYSDFQNKQLEDLQIWASVEHTLWPASPLAGEKLHFYFVFYRKVKLKGLVSVLQPVYYRAAPAQRACRFTFKITLQSRLLHILTQYSDNVNFFVMPGNRPFSFLFVKCFSSSPRHRLTIVYLFRMFYWANQFSYKRLKRWGGIYWPKWE